MVHQVVQAGLFQIGTNEWIPPRVRGITGASIEKKVSQIIHLFIICGIVLIGIQFSGECGVNVTLCVCAHTFTGHIGPCLNLLCLMGSEIHFS